MNIYMKKIDNDRIIRKANRKRNKCIEKGINLLEYYYKKPPLKQESQCKTREF